MSFTTGMAWNYSNWVTMQGASRVSQLSLHIQEVSDRITENYSIAGRSKGVDPLNAYIGKLWESYNTLGGNTPRTNPGDLLVEAWGCEPCDSDRGFSCAR